MKRKMMRTNKTNENDQNEDDCRAFMTFFHKKTNKHTNKKIQYASV